jgi:predicted nucleic acid-binding protein
MASRSFIDTNILVYAECRDEPVKQKAALALLRQLFASATGVLSTQVLKEYCNVALKKLKLPPAHIRVQLEVYTQFEVVQVTPAIIRAGLEVHQTRSIAFYDALIVASAQTAGCSVLFSADMNTGESVNRWMVYVSLIRLLKRLRKSARCYWRNRLSAHK